MNHNCILMDDCIFCKIVKKEIPADIVYEDQDTLVFLDIKPVSRGHLLVIPKLHSQNILDTSTETLTAITKTVQIVAQATMKALETTGFNLGVNNGSVAGQVVFHSHWHMIPRFQDDGLHMWPEKQYSPGEAVAIANTIRAHI